jgi:NADH-quinone oxidoreductase subunit K
MVLTIGLSHCLMVSSLVFCIGLVGIIINFKNVISTLLSLELILLSVNLNLVAFSRFNNDIIGQVFSIFVIAVSAAEAAIGLAILLVYYRKHGSILIDDIKGLRG